LVIFECVSYLVVTDVIMSDSLFQVQQFLHFCKGLYRDLPQLLPNIFEPRRNIRVNEIQELHIEQALAQAFCVSPIQTEQKHPDGSPVVVRSHFHNATSYSTILISVYSVATRCSEFEGVGRVADSNCLAVSNPPDERAERHRRFYSAHSQHGQSLPQP
jgi:hypothetical protein